MCAKSAATGRPVGADDAFARIVDLLGACRDVLVLTHARPDGDGLGSMAALAGCAAAAGKAAHMLVPDRVPKRYQFFFPDEPPAGADRFAPLAARADLIVVLDTCAKAQLGAVASGVLEHGSKVAVIDHHATADRIGAVQWLDASAAATGLMVAEVLEALGWPVSLPAAEILMTAVTTDTGWLRYANTDPRALRAVARWVAAGVRPDRLYRRLYQNDRPQRLKLAVRMLQSLELFCEGRLAVMVIHNRDFDETGALGEETENLVNEPLRLATVETIVLLVENPDCVRVSLRSRDIVNVARVAEAFGGGGHARAAGIRLSGNIDELKRRVVAACAKALDAAPPPEASQGTAAER